MGYLGLRHPVFQAPMAGGPSTPRLAAAVSSAGGLGFLAGGYLPVDTLREQIHRVRDRTTAPFGVNLFVPGTEPVDPDAVAAYADLLQPEADRLGVELGAVTGGDDNWAGKAELLLAEPVPVVSFAFGLPEPELLRSLQARGTTVLVTVTTPEEAAAATAAGADGLVAQGVEAGAHRGGFGDDDGVGEYGLLPLLRLVSRVSPLPVVAAGGIADGAAIAAVLAAGAVAAALGTAFLRCPEAGTGPVHRAALADRGALDRPAPTSLTRAFTGRRGRAIVNRFTVEYSASAPAAYPHVHQLTAPLRAAARSVGDAEAVNLWAGQAYPLTEEVPAAELVARLAAEARAAIAEAAARVST
jgi:nitronate monooxygenase